ncbi:hypothetical protein CEXT_151151 [Caerostris extrusa]|uniref:Uncharacterized protein n=1 Tax=Caerostris extrusa TaxID=172846 RepID=A0AAV4W7J1_CAEEX|nr:hypothetical protein CEXT_151151 [Caerostris extrusa]
MSKPLQTKSLKRTGPMYCAITQIFNIRCNDRLQHHTISREPQQQIWRTKNVLLNYSEKGFGPQISFEQRNLEARRCVSGGYELARVF